MTINRVMDLGDEQLILSIVEAEDFFPVLSGQITIDKI